jgi:hypothetical protein
MVFYKQFNRAAAATLRRCILALTMNIRRTFMESVRIESNAKMFGCRFRRKAFVPDIEGEK